MVTAFKMGNVNAIPAILALHAIHAQKISLAKAAPIHAVTVATDTVALMENAFVMLTGQDLHALLALKAYLDLIALQLLI
jgi:hypothetical protein